MLKHVLFQDKLVPIAFPFSAFYKICQIFGVKTIEELMSNNLATCGIDMHMKIAFVGMRAGQKKNTDEPVDIPADMDELFDWLDEVPGLLEEIILCLFDSYVEMMAKKNKMSISKFVKMMGETSGQKHQYPLHQEPSTSGKK